jgi:hypothetical protein
MERWMMTTTTTTNNNDEQSSNTWFAIDYDNRPMANSIVCEVLTTTTKTTKEHVQACNKTHTSRLPKMEYQIRNMVMSTMKTTTATMKQNGPHIRLPWTLKQNYINKNKVEFMSMMCLNTYAVSLIGCVMIIPLFELYKHTRRNVFSLFIPSIVDALFNDGNNNRGTECYTNHDFAITALFVFGYTNDCSYRRCHDDDDDDAKCYESSTESDHCTVFVYAFQRSSRYQTIDDEYGQARGQAREVVG